jgi:hypothetical protein
MKSNNEEQPAPLSNSSSQSMPDITPSAYPLLGITYFVTHPTLWCLVIGHLLVAVVLALIAIICIFIFLTSYQSNLLSKVMPIEAAWTLSIILSLIECVVATLLIVSHAVLQY